MRTLLIILIFLPSLAWAQADSLVLLSKNFKFEDGIYLSLEDFQQNQPAVSWDSVYARLHTNPQNLMTLVDTIHYKNNKEVGKLWGFSLGGIPYINLMETNEAGLQKYVGLKVRGDICYYLTKESYEKPETITAYNPLTGVPFRQAEIITEKERERPFILSFETGEAVDFNTDNFLDWIKEDKQLVMTVNNLPLHDRNDKLFKCLLIYLDRNPRYVPVRE